MSEAVLDASAVLAFLQSEPGSDAIADIMLRSCISSVNVAEVIAKFVEHGLTDEAACEAMLSLPIEIVPFSTEGARRSGLLHRLTRGRNISLGDRACLALAQELALPVLTTDRAWQELPVQAEVRVVR